MSESERRLWGIDLIACVYGLATILVVWLWFNGSSDKRTFAMVVAPLCAVVCIGLFLRINLVRVGFSAQQRSAVGADGNAHSRGHHRADVHLSPAS
jgi:hypothetical protein